MCMVRRRAAVPSVKHTCRGGPETAPPPRGTCPYIQFNRTPENGGVCRGHHWPKKLGQNILNFGPEARTAAGIAKNLPPKLGLGIGLRKSANFSRPAAPSAGFRVYPSHKTTIECVLTRRGRLRCVWNDIDVEEASRATGASGHASGLGRILVENDDLCAVQRGVR